MTATGSVGPLVTVTGGLVTLSVKSCTNDPPAERFAVTLNAKLPPRVGVPARTPATLSDRPGGRIHPACGAHDQVVAPDAAKGTGA